MNDSYSWLLHDHSGFEASLDSFTDAVEREAWSDAEDAFWQLVEGLKEHMAMEEEVLYPAYESDPDLPREPISALRAEHDSIVSMVSDLAEIIEGRDPEHTLQAVVPLEQRLIVHHEKEEDIFLPMAGGLLLPRKADITAKLATFDASTARRKWNLSRR